ncbi:hypothetical protein KIF24_20545 [Micromonospora sp. Llam7]|uniref:hypothetical protein n=1 Tax=Micromonospora tarapacensis TaxID=2835305 RepID=UPI001C82D45D|nr:hypothetical protein [Micromonospora tarapacensis]
MWAERRCLGGRLTEILSADVVAGRESTGEVRESAVALLRAMRTLVTFRGRHLGIAQRVYEVETDRFTTGSGGGSVELLRGVLTLTKENARLAVGSPAAAVPKPRSGGRDAAVGEPAQSGTPV